MAGALIHIFIGLLSAVIVHFIHFKKEFSFAVFIGNLLPDALKFGISAIVQGSILIFRVEHDSTYNVLASITGNFNYWFTTLIFVAAVCAFLYHHKYIKKKTMKEINKLYGFLLIGILIHLAIDFLVQEKGIWF